MSRMRRLFINEEEGCYHIISRTVGADFLLTPEDKDYFVNLLRRFSAGYFVKIHAFCVMDNHFHILATMCEEEGGNATEKELAERFWLINKGFSSVRTHKLSGNVFEIPEGLNIEKIRQRLTCLSRFVQDIKQTFSRYFNRKNNRFGYLWGDRFKGILVTRGEAELACAAYIDLNPVRAGIVKNPEDYRWSSIGLGRRSNAMQVAMIALPLLASEQPDSWNWYKDFLYEKGGINNYDDVENLESEKKSVKKTFDKFEFGEYLRHRILNFSKGLIFGTKESIKRLQQELQMQFLRKRIRACPLFGDISVTRVFKDT